ncbi:hypothetical protein DFH09DRAFT_1085532 [Mycena vulgaris]|nr:hypothetical protein DFH09DRAFT_1085532 [Mycena vulgaris]
MDINAGIDVFCVIATGMGKTVVLQSEAIAAQARGEKGIALMIVPTKVLVEQQLSLPDAANGNNVAGAFPQMIAMSIIPINQIARTAPIGGGRARVCGRAALPPFLLTYRGPRRVVAFVGSLGVTRDYPQLAVLLAFVAYLAHWQYVLPGFASAFLDIFRPSMPAFLSSSHSK